MAPTTMLYDRRGTLRKTSKRGCNSMTPDERSAIRKLSVQPDWVSPDMSASLHRSSFESARPSGQSQNPTRRKSFVLSCPAKINRLSSPT